MLRVRMISGEEVAHMPVEELSDARALKRQLNRSHGLPVRFRQRLFLGGNLLDDTVQLDSSMELELVLLPYSMTSRAEAKELADASANGSISKVRLCRTKLILNPQTPFFPN